MGTGTKIQNGDSLVPANPGTHGKVAVKMDRHSSSSSSSSRPLVAEVRSLRCWRGEERRHYGRPEMTSVRG